MRNIISSLALIVCGLLIPSLVTASPTLLYQFQLTRQTCFTEYSSCAQRYDALGDMTIGLTPDALVEGQAGLRIRSYPREGASEFLNDEFSSIALAFYPGYVRPVSLEVDEYLSNFMNLDLQVSLEVGRFLQGALYVNDTSSEIVMSTIKAFTVGRAGPESRQDAIYNPANENEWTGFIRSDAISSAILPFTGVWRFVGVVPEPGTLLLLLTAFAAMGGVAARRVRSAQSR